MHSKKGMDFSRSGSTSSGEAAAAAAEPYCTIVAADMSDFSYLSCTLCDRVLRGRAAASCPSCGLPTIRLYRLLLSIATHDRVLPVVLFDRAARVLLGCPAGELSRLFAARPAAARDAAGVLLGEMCRMELRASKRGTAEHLRAVSVVPLRAGFRPAIHTLRTLYPGG